MMSFLQSVVTPYPPELVGQILLGEGKPLRILIEHDQVPSMVLWGPGSGKTTLARLTHTPTTFAGPVP
jgi:putative ATPase